MNWLACPATSRVTLSLMRSREAGEGFAKDALSTLDFFAYDRWRDHIFVADCMSHREPRAEVNVSMDKMDKTST